MKIFVVTCYSFWDNASDVEIAGVFDSENSAIEFIKKEKEDITKYSISMSDVNFKIHEEILNNPLTIREETVNI